MQCDIKVWETVFTMTYFTVLSVHERNKNDNIQSTLSQKQIYDLNCIRFNNSFFN